MPGQSLRRLWCVERVKSLWKLRIMVDPSIFQLPPAIIEEAKKAKEPEFRIELECINLANRIELTMDIHWSHEGIFMECVNRNKGKVEPPVRRDKVSKKRFMKEECGDCHEWTEFNRIQRMGEKP